jgi:hypothetical protein
MYESMRTTTRPPLKSRTVAGMRTGAITSAADSLMFRVLLPVLS